MQILAEGKIYFSTVKELNDPFEYACVPTFGNCSFERKVEVWSRFRAEPLKSMNPSHQMEYIAQLENLAPDGIKLIMEGLGVFSASMTDKNLVLWSHYADGHAGIAVEIETDQVEILAKPREVEYVEKVRQFEYYHEEGGEVYKIASTKFSDWKYEREIRFFATPGIHQIPKESIKSVTFGFASRRKNWDSMREVGKLIQETLPTCEIYQVGSDRREYSVERLRLDKHFV